MSKKPLKEKAKSLPGFSHIASKGGFSEYRLKANGLTVLHKELRDTGVITSDIVYRVGAKDEDVGETGLAHMLEHMLFKPTKSDVRKGLDSASMRFERDTGCVLNANTWKDRTTYYFSYPTEYFEQAIAIEADRITNVVLNDREFQPERGSVLSEFDMYNSQPEFALAVQMVAAAYTSHPYGHETLGFREDIEDYTVEKLERFYRRYYRPENATIMIIGDVSLSDAALTVRKHFEKVKNPNKPIERIIAREPIQEGIKRVAIDRPSASNILALGVKHAGFPSTDWFTTLILLNIMAGGKDSLLYKSLVDAGIATSVSASVEPTSEENLATIFITLAPGIKHEAVEEQVLAQIEVFGQQVFKTPLKKAVAETIAGELFNRESSLSIARELAEYVAAEHWQVYLETEKILAKITPQTLVAMKKVLFKPNNMVIASFNGTK